MSHIKEEIKYTSFGTRINKDIKDHSNDPHILEKGRRSQEMLKQCGFPKGLPDTKSKSR